jgi:CHAT domain-containing protein/tetratricopeptide (TPR) repeat protein
MVLESEVGLNFVSNRVVNKLCLLALLFLSAPAPLQARSTTGPILKFHEIAHLWFTPVRSGATKSSGKPAAEVEQLTIDTQQPKNSTQDKSKALAANSAFDQAERLVEEGSADSLRSAIEKYGEALQLYRLVPDRGSEAKTLNNIGFAYDSLGEKQKALASFSQALGIYKAVEDLAGEATTLNNIAFVYATLGEKQKALEFFNQALPIYRVARDPSGEATTLNNIGAVYDSLGEKRMALGFFSQALPLWKELQDRNGEAATLNNMGQAYRTLGERQKALEFFNLALPIYRTIKNRRGEAGMLNNIAQLYDSLGQQQLALEFYNQALPLRRAVGDRGGEATTINNIGGVYKSLGEEHKALDFYNQALPIYKAVGNSIGEAGTLDNIGQVYMSLGEKQKALEFYSQALLLRRAVADQAGEATTLNNIGEAYASLGEKPRALEYYQRALQVHKAVGDRRGEAATLNNIGAVYYDLGEKQKAFEFYDQALLVGRAVGNREGEASTLHNLMVLWKTDNESLAIFFGKQAVNALQQLRTNISGLGKALQQTFLHSKEDTYRLLASLLISEGRLAEAQQVIGLLKEEEYFEFVRRQEQASLTAVRISFTPAEAELEKRFSDISDRIAEIGAERSILLSIKQRTADQEKRLSALEAQLEAANQVFQKFLDQLEVELKKSPRVGNDVRVLRESQALKDTLRELDAVALYSIVSPEQYNVILITPDVEKAYEYKIPEAELNKKVFAFREVLQDPNADPLPLAQEMYRILIGPELARDIAQTKKQTILWSLDGALRYLPMAALHDGKKYLVESYRNVVITLASHDHLKDSITPQWHVLGLGVSKREVIKTESNTSLIFPALPGVREELAGIVRDETRGGQKGVLPGKVMFDEDFTADAMQTALRLRGNEQAFKLVHIASHFNFEPGDETKSFLLLGGGKTLTLSTLRSMSQIFSKVELLTLSACNTASGAEGAEGKEVEGFAVLAQRQGAEAIIASLWPVSDPSTSQLMQQFYRLHEGHFSKGEAMRRAQVTLLRSFKANSKPRYGHPYYWAPFILIGNWK